MNSKLISSEQVSRIFTVYSPATIRELAAKGKMPVASWSGSEPTFRRDAFTIQSLLQLTRGEDRLNVEQQRRP
jgi:hypothetical protein